MHLLFSPVLGSAESGDITSLTEFGFVLTTRTGFNGDAGAALKIDDYFFPGEAAGSRIS